MSQNSNLHETWTALVLCGLLAGLGPASAGRAQTTVSPVKTERQAETAEDHVAVRSADETSPDSLPEGNPQVLAEDPPLPAEEAASLPPETAVQVDELQPGLTTSGEPSTLDARGAACFCGLDTSDNDFCFAGGPCTPACNSNADCGPGTRCLMSNCCGFSVCAPDCLQGCVGGGTCGTYQLCSGPGEDCNGNGISDATDIANGVSQDCQPNGIPDECEVPGENALFDPQVTYGAGTSPESVAVGDLDGDGDRDLAVANNGSFNVSVLLNNGNGTYAAQVTYGAGGQPGQMAVGDLDGDGDLDLVVALRIGTTVSVLLNNGNGSFAAPVFYGAGSNPISVAMGDLDGDGDPDLAVANLSSSNVSILLNNGNGTFAAQVPYGADSQPTSVAVGDLDGDGDRDLAVACNAFSTVSVLLNNGNGTFAARVLYGTGTGTGPNSVAVGDLDGDGDRDLATANPFSNNASVLLNNGNGTFAAPVTYAAGASPLSVALGDLDGDGDRDLAVANRTSSNVSVLRNNGNATFAAQVTYGAGSQPYSVAVGDLDGDGDPDLAVANRGSSNVSVLLHADGDCNGNGVPDECDPDCNANDIADDCDIAGGNSADCNANGTPDECELAGNDCNGNGTPDDCELAGNDCNANTTHDACEPDCNANGIADECDLAHNCCATGHGAGCSNPGIQACVCAVDPYCCNVAWDSLCAGEVQSLGCGNCGGASDDCNANGIPDECECDPVALLTWDFENATSVGSISTAVGVSGNPAITGFASQTGGGPAEYLGPTYGVTHLTRALGTYHPFIEFTLSCPLVLDDVTFQHLHNHNPGYPTNPSYDVQLQIDTGSGYTDVGTLLTLSSANSGQTDTMSLNVSLGPGTYRIRWDPRNLAFGGDTSSEFFALNDLVVNGTYGGCVPAATVTGAVSRKANPAGPGGVCDLPLVPATQSEPRQGGITEVRIAFDVPPGGPGPSPVTIEQATCAAPAYVAYPGVSTISASVAGNELLLTFSPGLENARTYRINLNSEVTSLGGQFVEVSGLLGDVNSDGQVNATDRSVVVGAWTGGGFTCPTDANSDGQTNALDRSVVVGAWTGAQNCAP